MGYGPGLQAWYTGPYPPPGARESTWTMIWRTGVKAVVAAGCFGVTLGFAFFLPVIILAVIIAAVSDSGGNGEDVVYGEADAPGKLLSIPVTGVILGEELEPAGFFGLPGVVYGYEVREKLRKAAEDSDIAGVILEFETPGGTIFGARAIAAGIEEYRAKTGKPVVAFVAGLSASGGMYAMAPADLILADYGSLVGSIGVTMGAVEYWDGIFATEGGILGGGVTTRNGIIFQPITAGRSKDVGAPYRPLTEQEKAELQRGVENEYAEFVRYVAAKREIPEATIRDRIGAMVYDNATAQELGLIDGTADRPEAYARAAALAGLEAGKFRVVRETGGGWSWGGLLGKLGLGSGDRAEAPAAGPTRICFPAHAILAYYGDPVALCARGR
ncbi:S49 family peptidase [Tepidiforma sp.]|uniref:S49 family peptidase n=1 Tax=Tepidiforma sp. TaxID=2682230 RepID=UPI00258DCA2E|nr:S49 family peptidase [Tepidiforma sp.]